MSKHGFTVEEKQLIKERFPNESCKFIAKLLNCSTDKVKSFAELNNIKKEPLHLRKPSFEFLLKNNSITEYQYYEIVERAEHEPVKFISDDMGIDYKKVLMLTRGILRLPPEDQIYTKQYSLHVFGITSEKYDEIVQLGSTCTVQTIIQITKCTKNCIQKVLFSYGIDEVLYEKEVIPERVITDISQSDVELIIKYYPHFTNKRLKEEFGLDKNDIKLVVKHYGIEKLPDDKKLCIVCRVNTRVGTEAYSSYCRSCFTEMMIEYQKEYYPNNKHRIPCRIDDVQVFRYLEGYK